jgi:polysaccharide export outer membrane protein
MKILIKKMSFWISFLLLAVMLRPGLLSAQQMASAGANANALPVAEASGPQSRLRIGAGDLINVNVFDVPEMTQTARVNDLGNASLHLIGSLHLAGMTTDEATVFIAGKLKDGNYILDPQVSVFISEYSTQGVSVLGEVNKPGVYNVLGSRSLLDILSEAGGTTAAAGTDVTVKHLDGSTASVRLTKNARESLATDIELLPGDKVIIPRAGLIYVLGDVGHPGGFMMENDGKISLLQAIASAGGTTRTASMNQCRLIRKSANGYTDTTVPLKKLLKGEVPDMQLQAEDIVYMPTSLTKAAVYRTAPELIAAASSAAIYRGIP